MLVHKNGRHPVLSVDRWRESPGHISTSQLYLSLFLFSTLCFFLPSFLHSHPSLCSLPPSIFSPSFLPCPLGIYWGIRGPAENVEFIDLCRPSSFSAFGTQKLHLLFTYFVMLYFSAILCVFYTHTALCLILAYSSYFGQYVFLNNHSYNIFCKYRFKHVATSQFFQANSHTGH